MAQPRLLLFFPLCPNSLFYPMDCTVIRHLVLMSFPSGHRRIAFIVAVGVACEFTSPFASLAAVEWVGPAHTYRVAGAVMGAAKLSQPRKSLHPFVSQREVL